MSLTLLMLGLINLLIIFLFLALRRVSLFLLVVFFSLAMVLIIRLLFISKILFMICRLPLMVGFIGF